MFFIKRA